MATSRPPLAHSARAESTAASDLVCHCRRVSYAAVEAAIDRGRVASLGDVQRETTACTRCFGCRFELERMLEQRLGEGYVRARTVTLPPAGTPPESERLRRLANRFRRGSAGLPAATPEVLPRRMYMPVLQGFRDRQVETRVILFNLYEEFERRAGRRETVTLRVDLMTTEGERLGVSEMVIQPGHSAVLDAAELLDGQELPGGVGVTKLVVDSEQLASFRPYFHFVSPGGVSSTHEKPAPSRPSVRPRRYYWVFPVGFTSAPEEAYMVLTNAQAEPIDGRELVWRSTTGEEERLALDPIGLDQTAWVALHERFPAIGRGDSAGTVRLEPSIHVAGFMIRYRPEIDAWRVQHL
jgi:bacterioferritin-associated ferredoxin